MKHSSYLLLLLSVILLFSCKKDEEQRNEPVPDSPPLFSRSEEPVFESPLGLAADPSVVRNGDTLLLFYSAEDHKIGVVLSTDDGQTWSSPDGNDQEDYGAIAGQPDGWDSTLETVDVVKVGDEYWMYYTGYREDGSDNPHIANYEVGLAISTNGVDFVRHPSSVDGPVLSRDTSSVDTYDRHAMTSPGVVYADGTFYMIYAGWNVSDDWTGPNAGIRILGATSDDGISWEKLSEPVIIPSQVTYSPDINEASLARAADGMWYIPFSTDMSIGVARSSVFSGGYEIYDRPIVEPAYAWDSEVTAPDVIIENGQMRLWYHGVVAPAYWPWVIGYSEAAFPLDW